MITMKEIAEKAGVSQTTVSRVINGNPLVDSETKQKVMEWVRKLDYQPNRAAQSLATKQSYLLGMVIPDVTNPYFSEVLKAVEQTADLNGYNIVLCDSRGNLQKEKRCLNILRRHQVAGVLLVPVDKEASLPNVPKSSMMPVIAITQDLAPLDSVCVSHQHGGALVARHLLELGHTRIAIIETTGEEKFRGFHDVLTQAGIPFQHENFIHLQQAWEQLSTHEIHEKLNAYLDRKPRLEISALFAYNDIAAFVATHIMQERGYRVPDDIAIVGFDNTFLARESRPQLTSVAQPISEIGRLGLEMLLDRISGKKTPHPSKIILEPTLVVRESTRATHISG